MKANIQGIDLITKALTEAGLTLNVFDNGKITIEPAHIRVKKIEWETPTQCYATLPNGNQIPVIFTEMENQIEVINES